MDTMDWVAVVLPVFGIIVGLLGWRWTRAKKLLADVVAILTLISDAVQDDELTRQEVKDIVAEAMKRLFNK